MDEVYGALKRRYGRREFMKTFGKNHPILFTVLLFIAGMIMAVVLAIPFMVIGASNDICFSVSRILTGGLFFFLFRYCFAKMRPFSSFPYAIAAFLFGVWNLVYNPLSGNSFAAPGIDTVIIALAPAVFEEVIFRGISIWFLKEKGYSELTVLMISALLFGLVHLTNIAGISLANVLVQTVYACVIGLVFASIYLRSSDFVILVLAHFFTDFTSHLFLSETETSIPVLICFIVFLLGEGAYAFWLVTKKKQAE